jgi:hypothetical protein
MLNEAAHGYFSSIEFDPDGACVRSGVRAHASFPAACAFCQPVRVCGCVRARPRSYPKTAT